MDKFWRVLRGWIFILVTLLFSLQLIGLTLQISSVDTVISIVALIFIPFMIWYVKVDMDIKYEKLTQLISQSQPKESE